jgi:hypothetical protein
MNIRTIDPTRDDLKRLAQIVPLDTPVTMLNLLRYRAEAAYPADAGYAPCSGREAYQRYAGIALQKIRELGGEPVFMAPVLSRVIAPEGEEWDDLLLVRYPSLGALLTMIGIGWRRSKMHGCSRRAHRLRNHERKPCVYRLRQLAERESVQMRAGSPGAEVHTVTGCMSRQSPLA